MAFEFTDQQKAVINHDPNRHGIVRAGPGTGKSATVVALAQRLQTDRPDVRLRFLTFTRAATSELSQKISSTEGLKLKPSTIHSFAMSILMQNQDALPVILPIRIPSEHEEQDIVYPYIGRLIGVNKKRVKRLVQAYSSMWESLDTDFTVEAIAPEEKARFVSAFQHATRIFGFTLLSQLPDLLRRLLRDHTDVKGLDFDFLIVDEYQDLNKCEIELFKILSDRGIKILAVGDEDQSIYSFRNAAPTEIRSFEQKFPGAISYDLSICHRCPNNLLSWAQHVILGDLDRSNRPFPISESANAAETKLLNFPGDISEAREVAKFIIQLLSNGFQVYDILVLTRSDLYERFTKSVKEILHGQGVETYDPRDLKTILDNRDSRKLFSTLRLIENEKDSLAWYTLLQETSGIGSATIGAILKNSEDKNISFGESVLEDEQTGKLQSVRKFQDLRKLMGRVQAEYRKVKDVDQIKWGEWIISTAAPLLSIQLSDQLTKLLIEADAQMEMEATSLSYFISQVNPIAKDIANEQKTGVRFMTMQSSKGLTARATIVIGVDNDLVPSPRNNNINEERRLLYVAMTRSQELLAMTWTNRRRGSQARSGNVNLVRRNYTQFLESGPVQSEDGARYVATFSGLGSEVAPH